MRKFVLQAWKANHKLSVWVNDDSKNSSFFYTSIIPVRQWHHPPLTRVLHPVEQKCWRLYEMLNWLSLGCSHSFPCDGDIDLISPQFFSFWMLSMMLYHPDACFVGMLAPNIKSKWVCIQRLYHSTTAWWLRCVSHWLHMLFSWRFSWICRTTVILLLAIFVTHLVLSKVLHSVIQSWYHSKATSFLYVSCLSESLLTATVQNVNTDCCFYLQCSTLSPTAAQ